MIGMKENYIIYDLYVEMKKYCVDATTTNRLRDDTFVCDDEVQIHTDFNDSPVQMSVALHGLKY